MKVCLGLVHLEFPQTECARARRYGLMLFLRLVGVRHERQFSIRNSQYSACSECMVATSPFLVSPTPPTRSRAVSLSIRLCRQKTTRHLRRFTEREKKDAELVEEIDSHLAHEQDANAAAGLSGGGSPPGPYESSAIQPRRVSRVALSLFPLGRRLLA